MALKVIGWPGAPLAADLAAELDAESCALALHRFPDGETLVRLDTGVDGHDVVFAVSLDGADAKALPLLFAADAARELGARRVLLVAPYLAYMRQDKRFHAGEALSSRTFARLVSSSFDALVTVDPHLHRWRDLAQLFTIPARAAHAAPAMAQWIAANVEHPLIVGPDSESEQWVAQVARLAGAPWVVMQKTRRGDADVSVRLPGPLAAGRTPVLVDDIVSTGRSLVAAAGALAEAGMRGTVAVAVHALFEESAGRALHIGGIERIVSCDTIAHPSNGIRTVPALARAVRDIISSTG